MATGINASRRLITGKQVKSLRREGLVPAIIYGHKIDPILISLDAREASHILPALTSSQLLEVNLEGISHNVLVREKQRHPVNGHLLHVDFQEISMTERLRTNVQIDYFGDAPAIKNYNGIVVTNLEEVEIEALPANLPERILVDLKVLKGIGDVIRVKDIHLPAEVEVLNDPDEIVAIVTPPAMEEEVVAAGGESVEPEVIEKGKKEEEF
jgi:large subunit ribosomal protein L25